MFRGKEWIAPSVATVAFLVALATFVFALAHCWRSVLAWSNADLESRARLTAAALSEPIRTLDFKAIGVTAAQLKAEGLRLRIVAGSIFYVTEGDERIGFYDTCGEPNPADVLCSWGVAGVGDFQVGIGRPLGKMLLPFIGALAVVALAGLVGVIALGAVFFVLYRQRMRIRELAKLERFRRDFVADVSHEIRTPLTGILGAAEMLETGDGMQAKLVDMIRGESKRLESLVQQILDLARLEREGDVLSIAETDVASLVAELAGKYGVRLDCGDAGVLVAKCDAQLVSQAVSNLIENALRHSGTTDIAVSARRMSGGGVEIAVEDHGKGVPAEHAARIFERFHRADPARAAESGGAGLGLAIVRRIARLHGGDASYAPAKPHGSRFTITLENC